MSMSKRAKLQSDPEQYRRFVEAARELGCDDDEERFAEVVRTVARAPVPSASEIKAGAKAARNAKTGRKP
jgi:hypothetical protein